MLLHCASVGCDNKAGDDISLQSPPAASSRTVITPELIRPFPKAGARKAKARTQKMKWTRILTDTPEKKLLEETEVMRSQRRAKPASKKKQQDSGKTECLPKTFCKRQRPQRAKAGTRDTQ